MIKLLLVPIIIIGNLYTFSFAKFSWKSKNRLAAVGAVILSILAILLPAYVIITQG